MVKFASPPVINAVSISLAVHCHAEWWGVVSIGMVTVNNIVIVEPENKQTDFICHSLLQNEIVKMKMVIKISNNASILFSMIICRNSWVEEMAMIARQSCAKNFKKWYQRHY